MKIQTPYSLSLFLSLAFSRSLSLVVSILSFSFASHSPRIHLALLLSGSQSFALPMMISCDSVQQLPRANVQLRTNQRQHRDKRVATCLCCGGKFCIRLCPTDERDLLQRSQTPSPRDILANSDKNRLSSLTKCA